MQQNNQQSASKPCLECGKPLTHPNSTGYHKGCAITALMENKEVTPPTDSEPSEVGNASCKDCGRDYVLFNLDLVFSDKEWQQISGEEQGLLCERCIVNRAEKIKGVTRIDARLGYASYSEPPEVGKEDREHEESLLIKYEEATYQPAKPVKGDFDDSIKVNIMTALLAVKGGDNVSVVASWLEEKIKNYANKKP